MIWAWRRGRVRTDCPRLVDRMLCILPFEEDFYRSAGVRGPLRGQPGAGADARRPARRRSSASALGLAPVAPTLALLPGSRMERAPPHPARDGGAREQLLAQERPGLQVVVPVAPTIAREEVAGPRFEGSGAAVRCWWTAAPPRSVGASDAAVVASGTAALEAGLMQRPLVVVYRVSLLSYLVGRLMLKVAFVSLVNLLAGRRVVPELLQGDMTPGADRRGGPRGCGCRARRARGDARGPGARCGPRWAKRARRAARGGRRAGACLGRACLSDAGLCDVRRP